ncbi:MAG: cyclase family protein [Rubricoccaceae bacterium]|nr:cyclase family protein [Rubricoccaceae bacterium]
MRCLLLAALVAAPPTVLAQSLAELLAAHTIVDLSHAYDAETIYWPTEEGFVLEEGFAGTTEGGYYYAANAFRSAEHGGTHLDAPIHFAEGRQTVDAIPLEHLVGPAVVVDVSEAALADPDYQVTRADVEAWEAEHGRLPDGAIVLLNTGYARFWPDRVRYMGTDARGPEAVAALHFPGLHPEAARWLVEERSIHAIGLDTPSIDHGPSRLFEAHRILFEANVPAFENVANLDGLPAHGFVVAALPMKIRGGSGGPLRIVAFVPAP